MSLHPQEPGEPWKSGHILRETGPQGGLKDRIDVAVLHLRKMPGVLGPQGWEGDCLPETGRPGWGGMGFLEENCWWRQGMKKWKFLEAIRRNSGKDV